MRTATLVFPILWHAGAVHRVLLAMKKRGFGEGRWNGAGGKVKDGETVLEAAVREVNEELSIVVHSLKKVAELSFTFPHEPSFDQIVHVYLTNSWDGEPAEGDEMRPKWFAIDSIPYGEMWSDDILWLPHILDGKRLKGAFVFAPGDTVASHTIEIVESF